MSGASEVDLTNSLFDYIASPGLNDACSFRYLDIHPCLIPERLVKLLFSVDPLCIKYTELLKFKVYSIQNLARYCNVGLIAPRSFSIDTFNFVKSPLWEEILEKVLEDVPLSSTDAPVIDPICPLLQNLLSSVEHLNIGTIKEFKRQSFMRREENNFSFDAPYFILRNIVTCEKPMLKSLMCTVFHQLLLTLL